MLFNLVLTCILVLVSTCLRYDSQSYLIDLTAVVIAVSIVAEWSEMNAETTLGENLEEILRG